MCNILERREQMNYKYLPMLLLYLVFSPSIACAYIDPGTGSYVLQIVLAVFIGGLYALKIYWRRLKSYFFKNNKNDHE